MLSESQKLKIGIGWVKERAEVLIESENYTAIEALACAIIDFRVHAPLWFDDPSDCCTCGEEIIFQDQAIGEGVFKGFYSNCPKCNTTHFSPLEPIHENLRE